MGCLFVLVLGGMSAALVSFFGYPLWVMVVLGSLWLAAVVVSAIYGHHGFGGQGNTDLTIVIAGLAIAAAIIIPQREAQKPCNQARRAVTKLADAENEYFSKHKTFTTDLARLNLKQNPEIHMMILGADEQSFVAAATHASCNKDKDGTPLVFMWDSAKGGLQ